MSANAISSPAARRRFNVPGEPGPLLVAALAAVLRRYGDVGSLVLGYGGEDASGSVLSLEVGDDPRFDELLERAGEALAAATSMPSDAVLDGYVSLGPAAPEGVPAWLVLIEGAELLACASGGGPGSEALASHVTTLLGAAAEDPARTIDRLPLLDEAERTRLLTDWNQTEAEYPRRCLHELFAEQALRTPGRVAVACGGEELTYRELDERSNRLAHRLIELGVGAEVLVGISVQRSVHMVVGLLGILKAGGAYVPIDPTYPLERQEFMLRSSEAPVVVTEQVLLGGLPLEGLEVVCLDRDWERIAAQPATAPEVTAEPEQLAYVIYTSGSTGQPKGVQIPHRALINFLTTMGQRPGLSDEDVLVAVTTLSFDIAGLELHLPLVSGAKVVIAPAPTASDPRALAHLLSDSAATIMQATPTTWRMLLDSGWRPAGTLKALCGGEALPVALADRLVGAGVELWNMYGPTETTIWSTCAPIRTQGQSLTIGRPIANTTIYILDRHLEPTPVAVPGELWIGGDGLARGYRGRDDLTAERFVADPFAGREGARMYRTGDLARYREDGEIEFLGRIDHQVKVRGYRIELGEIETVLTRHPGVKEAVVVARADAGEAELAAYVIPVGEAVPAHELREFAGRSLPAYMVPLTVTTMKAFPLTPNGKVDRKALPEPARERSSQTELVAPRTELEAQLLAIWERELGISPIGVTDDFFDLGVTSIVAATLFAAIEHELGSSLPLGAIFRAPTIEALAGLLEGPSEESRWTSLIPIQPGGTKPPIFCVHGGAGTILHLAPLARRLGQDQPFYGLQSRGLYGGAPPLRSVEDMATHYLKEMREVHPGGPWRIAGYCFGTIVAFELAQRLLAEGEEVELLAMFNGPSPSWIKTWGWYGNQPGWRARHAMPPPPTVAQRKVNRRKRKVQTVLRTVAKLPRLLRHPGKLITGLAWHFRGPIRRTRMALGLPVSESDREIFFFDLHAAAERAYEPVNYPGEILLFSGERMYDDPTLGWEGLCDTLEVIIVPGDHDNNRQVMHEPAVQHVAERLEAYFAERDATAVAA